MTEESGVTREALEQEGLAAGGEDWREWFDLHRNKILGALLVVVLLVLALRVGGNISARRDLESRAILAEARNYYLNALSVQEAAERDSMIEAARARLTELEENYAGKPAAQGVELMRGRLALAAGQPEQALDHFENHRNASSNPAEKAKAWLGIAAAHENLYYQDMENETALDKALEAYGQVERLAGDLPRADYLAGEALLQRARLEEWRGNPEQALALYRRVLEERPHPESEILEQDPAQKNPRDMSREERAEFYREFFRRQEAQFSYEAAARAEIERLEAIQQQ